LNQAVERKEEELNEEISLKNKALQEAAERSQQLTVIGF